MSTATSRLSCSFLHACILLIPLMALSAVQYFSWGIDLHSSNFTIMITKNKNRSRCSFVELLYKWYKFHMPNQLMTLKNEQKVTQLEMCIEMFRPSKRCMIYGSMGVTASYSFHRPQSYLEAFVYHFKR